MEEKIKTLILKLCFKTVTPANLIIAVKALLWMLWPATAIAATSIYGSADGKVTIAEICVTVLISALSGTTSLLYRMHRQLEQTGELAYVWMLATSHMSGAVVAGLFMFFLTEAQGLGDLNQVVAVIPASFGGVFLLERAFLWIADKYLPVKGSSKSPFSPNPQRVEREIRGFDRADYQPTIDEPNRPPEGF